MLSEHSVTKDHVLATMQYFVENMEGIFAAQAVNGVGELASSGAQAITNLMSRFTNGNFDIRRSAEA